MEAFVKNIFLLPLSYPYVTTIKGIGESGEFCETFRLKEDQFIEVWLGMNIWNARWFHILESFRDIF